jgi:hypothetical protein
MPATVSGKTPAYRPCRFVQGAAFPTAESLLDAFRDEVKEGLAQGYTPLDVNRVVKERYFVEAGKLKAEEKALFELEAEPTRWKENDFTSEETTIAGDRLKKDGRLTFQQGYVDPGSVRLLAGGRIQVSVVDNQGHTQILDGDLCINCMGSVKITTAMEPAHSLLEKHLVELNATKTGFKVNENYEASPGFFIAGLMLDKSLVKDRYLVRAGNIEEIHAAGHKIGKMLADDIVSQVGVTGKSADEKSFRQAYHDKKTGTGRGSNVSPP